MKLSSIISLATLVGSSLACTEKTAFVPRSKCATALIADVPRGGAGPLDPVTVAKTSATGLLAIHILCALGPEKSLETYGVKQPIAPAHVFVAQREWTFFLAAALTSYLVLVHETSVNTAVGFGTFPIILEVLRSILNDEEKKLGIPNVGQLVVVMAPLVVLAYACLSNMDNANTVTTVCGAYNVVKGIWYFLDTEKAGKKWGLTEGTDNPVLLGSAQWMAISVLDYGLLLLGLAQGMDAAKLMGYGWIPVVLNMVRETFFMEAVDNCDLNKSLYYIWMVLGAVVIGTLERSDEGVGRCLPGKCSTCVLQ